MVYLVFGVNTTLPLAVAALLIVMGMLMAGYALSMRLPAFWAPTGHASCCHQALHQSATRLSITLFHLYRPDMQHLRIGLDRRHTTVGYGRSPARD